MGRTLYYAVNGSGQGVVFTSCPTRDDHFKIWCGEIMGMYSSLVSQFEAEGLITLPVGMKWKNDPIEIELSLSLKQAF